MKPSARPDPHLTRLAWLGVKVADVVAQTLFFEQTLGLRFVDEGNTGAAHHVRYDCRTLELELVSGGTAWATRPKPRLGTPDLPLIPSFQVDNIDKLAEKLNDQELLLTQVFEQGWSASFLLFDPQRNLWQINETRTDRAVGTEEAGVISALWLAVEDFPAQVAFYRDVLGLPLSDMAVRPRPITLQAEQYQLQTPAPSNPLELTPEEQAEARQQETNPEGFSGEARVTGATFFSSGARLAISPGGRGLPDKAERVWGRDTAFLPGFITNDLEGMLARLKSAGVRTSGLFPYPRSFNPRTERRPSEVNQAFRFADPEGHCWQVFG